MLLISCSISYDAHASIFNEKGEKGENALLFVNVDSKNDEREFKSGILLNVSIGTSGIGYCLGGYSDDESKVCWILMIMTLAV
jgi:hypothetical protein